MYFAILSNEKFYDAVIYWNHYDPTIMKWGEFAKRKECEISDALSSFIRDFMKKHELSRRKYFQQKVHDLRNIYIYILNIIYIYKYIYIYIYVYI